MSTGSRNERIQLTPLHQGRSKQVKKLGFVAVLLVVWLYFESATFSNYVPSEMLSPSSDSPARRSPTSLQRRFQQFLNTLSGALPWAAICTVGSHQELYLDDWIDYHLALGFEHIFMVDTHPNFTLASWYADRHTQESLRSVNVTEASEAPPNIAEIELDIGRRVHIFHGTASDDRATTLYDDCLDRLRALDHPPKWVMVLDVDEYLVVQDGDRSTNVVAVLTQFVPRGAWRIHRRTMGSANAISYSPEPVTRRFQLALTGERWHTSTAAVAVLDQVDHCDVPDATGAALVTDRRAGTAKGNASVAAIFHYKYKSFDEFNDCVRSDSTSDRNANCPTHVQVGDTWDDTAWNAMKRLVPKYADLDSTSEWTLDRIDDPPIWAALCVVVAVGDDRYLDEWLDYHLAIGFEHVYIYGANTTYDALSSRLGKRQHKEAHEDVPPSTSTARRIVTGIAKGDSGSLLANCLGDLSKLPTPPKWIMSLSVDQYLVIRDMTRYPNVVSFLSEYLQSGSLEISSIVMGSANETAYTEAPVTQRFQYAVSASHHSETRLVAVLDHALKTFDLGQNVTTSQSLMAAVYHFVYKSTEEYQYHRCKYNCTNKTEAGDEFDDSAWQAMMYLVPKYRLPWAAICSAMKDEDLYVDEWTDYHLALGFEHIFIYDTHPNNTLASWHADRLTKEAEDPGYTYLQRTATARRVHIIHHEKEFVPGFQESVYNACLARLRAMVYPPKWVMVIDADEYLVLRDMDRYPNAVAFLTEHVQSGSLQISWNTMGSGSHIEYLAEPVTRRFQFTFLEEKWDVCTKAVAVLDHVAEWHVHNAATIPGFSSVGMGGRAAFGSLVYNHDVSVAAIFHYKYKSFDEFNERQCVRGDIMHDRQVACPTHVEVGNTWDDSAWSAMKRLVPKYAELDLTSPWTPVLIDDPPIWAALCIVVDSDPDRYYDEWLDYHLALGFEHIYMYGGGIIHQLVLGKRQYREANEDKPPSTSTARRVVARLTQGDHDSLIADCLGEAKKMPIPPKWIMSLSVDQYLVIRDTARYPNVVSFLSDHLHSGSLQISRIVMGSANESAYTDLPFTQRFQFAVNGSRHSQTRPVAVLDHVDALMPFHAVHKAGYNAVGMGGRVPSPECCITDGDVSVAAVYHYLYKSAEEYRYDLCWYGCIPEGEAGDTFDDSAWHAMMHHVPKWNATKTNAVTNAVTNTTQMRTRRI